MGSIVFYLSASGSNLPDEFKLIPIYLMKLFLSLSLILLVSCHSNTRKHASSNPGKDDLYSLIEKGAWTTYQHRDSIPDLLAEYLDRAGGGELKWPI